MSRHAPLLARRYKAIADTLSGAGFPVATRPVKLHPV
jgi:hypothetical protein